jgi:starch synthase
MVTRIDPQKGVDLAIAALRLLLQSMDENSPIPQAVFLGTGDPILESAVRHLEQDYPEHVRARIMYDERLSRHIYAGADVLLMPSRYEPCGLSQMIAMHYGCVPIARATGGLSDTIHDPTTSDKSTGFLFKKAKPDGLADAIQRALKIYSQDSPGWQKIQIQGMQQDFSWDRSAREYLKGYRMLFGRK